MPDYVKQKVLSAKDLDVYKVSYDLAMEIFEISRAWPKEEKYSLTDQIRRSSRSVCANLRESWLPARRAQCSATVSYGQCPRVGE